VEIFVVFKVPLNFCRWFVLCLVYVYYLVLVLAGARVRR
jgi:hypothetical protein